MLTCSNKEKIFVFDFIHHCVHFSKTHNAIYNIAADHKWRNAESEAFVDHIITTISDHCFVKAGSVGIVRDFIIRHNRFAKTSEFNIFAVIFSNWHAFVDDVWNGHHNLFDFFCQFFFIFFELVNAVVVCFDLFFNFVCFVNFFLFHKHSNLA